MNIKFSSTRRNFLGFLGAAAPASVALAETMIPEQESPKGLIMLPHSSGPLPEFHQPDFDPSRFMQMIRYAMYDRVRLPDDGQYRIGEPGRRLPANLDLFVRPLGQPGAFGGPPRTMADTNMYQAAVLPAPQEMHVDRIFFTFSGLMQSWDIQHILDAYVAELYVAEKVMYRSPLLLYPNIAELDQLSDPATGKRLLENVGFVVPSAATGRAVPGWKEGATGEQGSPVPFFSTFLDIPILIELRQCFYMRLTATEPVPVHGHVSFFAFLDGLMRRGVQ